MVEKDVELNLKSVLEAKCQEEEKEVGVVVAEE